MVLHCDNIFDEKAGGFRPGEIYIEGERFVSSAGGEKREYPGCYAVPGFIDLHVHGAFGKNFLTSAPADIDRTAAFFASAGVTSFFAGTDSGTEEAYLRGFDALAASAAAKTAAGADAAAFAGGPLARLAGIYLEGFFLSPEKPGAMDPSTFRAPDPAFFQRLRAYAANKGFPVKFVTIAPELEGAAEFIREVSKEAVCCLAHSAATYEQAIEAFKNGAGQVTHLFNAMNQLLHRAPGPVGAAFDSPGVRVELIADGEHIHPSMVRAAFKIFGDERIILISDGLFSGVPDGDYEDDKHKITVRNGVVRTQSGALAGGSKALSGCVINAVKNIGIPLFQAVKCATVNPAKQAGLFGETGSIEAGKYADLVILDKDYAVKEIFVRGRPLEKN